MTKLELRLFKQLLKAAKSGECPCPGCRICAEKKIVIKKAEKFIESREK